MKTKLTIFTTLLITCLSFAQNGFNYKAIIKDGLGNVVSMQNITLQFTIYEGVENVYQETHPLTTDLNGIVITNIGEGATNDDFSSVNWGNNNLYLKVEVDIKGGTEFIDMGTTQFKSVPFAKVSVKATDMQINDLTDVDGIPSNGQVLKFDGTGWTPATDETGAGGSSLWTENGANIYYNGKVGIGITNPIKMFHVKTSDQATARFESTGTKNYLEFFSSSQYQGYLGLNNGVRDLDFGTGFGNFTGKVHLVTGAFPRLTVAAGGNVGIGTTSPASKLDIAGGQWDLFNTEGDFRIGNDTYRLKIGVSQDGGGAGRAHIRAQGGINEIVIGTGNAEGLKIKQNGIEVTKELNRPKTGNADLIPIAYGAISSDGTILNGTGNFRVERPGTIGVFLIIIDFEDYSPATHTSLVTLQAPGQRSFIYASSLFNPGGNALAVSTSVLRDNGEEDGRQFLSFSFVVYKK